MNRLQNAAGKKRTDGAGVYAHVGVAVLLACTIIACLLAGPQTWNPPSQTVSGTTMRPGLGGHLVVYVPKGFTGERSRSSASPETC